MKEEQSEEIQDNTNSFTKDILEMISRTKWIYDSAYTHYLNQTERILNKSMVEPNEIELLLDYLLNFCDDNRFVCLYKRACRKLYQYDPQAAIEYVNMYKQLYKEED